MSGRVRRVLYWWMVVHRTHPTGLNWCVLWCKTRSESINFSCHSPSKWWNDCAKTYLLQRWHVHAENMDLSYHAGCLLFQNSVLKFCYEYNHLHDWTKTHFWNLTIRKRGVFDDWERKDDYYKKGKVTYKRMLEMQHCSVCDPMKPWPLHQPK